MELVSEQWSKIEAVASALLEEKTLRGQCLEVIYCSIEEGLDWRQELAAIRRLRGIDPSDN